MFNKRYVKNVVVNYLLSLLTLNIFVWFFNGDHIRMSLLMTGCYLLFVGVEIFSDLWQ